MNIAPRPCVFQACRRSMDAARSRTVRSNSLSISCATPSFATCSFRLDRYATAGFDVPDMLIFLFDQKDWNQAVIRSRLVKRPVHGPEGRDELEAPHVELP